MKNIVLNVGKYMINIKKVIKVLTWMVAETKWRADETKLNFSEQEKGGYSPELSEASDVLDELNLEFEKRGNFNV